jgi:hypothetical protein
VVDGFLSLTKRSSSINQSPPPSPFFGFGVTKDTPKPKFFLPIRDNDSYNGLCSSGKLIFVINEAQL